MNEATGRDGFDITRGCPWYRATSSTTTVKTSGSQAERKLIDGVMVDGVMVAAFCGLAMGAICLARRLSAQEIRDRDDQVRKDGFSPVDVAGYNLPISADPNSDRDTALWSQRTSATEDVRLLVGIENLLRKEGWHFQTMQQVVDSAGTYRYSCVQRRQENATNLSSNLGEKDDIEKVATSGLQLDLAVSAGRSGPSVREGRARSIQVEAVTNSREPTANTAQLWTAMLRLRATLFSGLFEDVEAIALLTAVLAQDPADLDARRCRAISFARLREREAAMADVAEFTR